MYNLNEERTFAIRVCWLIMKVGRDVTRHNLDSIFPPGSGPGTLDAELKRFSTKSKLNSLCTKKHINNFDISKLYPVPGVTGDSKDFDVSLLIKLLRNICSLRTPKNGWDNMPNPSDISLEDDLARIKQYRNKIAHGEFLLSADDFDGYWAELSDALIRIGGTSLQPTIDSLLMDPLTEEAMEAKKELHEWYMMEIDVNKKFDKQFDKFDKEIEKLGLMCQKIEDDKSANHEMFKNLQDQFSSLVVEINTDRAMSSEQTIQLHNIRERLKGIEKKMNGNQNTGDIIRHVVTYGFPIFIAVILMFYWPDSKPGQMPVDSSLKSLTENFVGRDEDINKIIHLLESEQQGMVTVKAPYGFGTSEVVVAVGHKMLENNDMRVFHIDTCDSGQTVSGKLITILGLIPLPDTIAQLSCVCPTLKKTLLIFDNVDCISDKKHLKIDFEKTLRLLKDVNICGSISILCATQQTFTILINLGIEYPLGPIDIVNATVLLSRINPTLTHTVIKRLAVTSMGIPLAINLITDLLLAGHAPEDIIKELQNDIESLEKVIGLEETRKLITIALQYIRKQEPSVQDALQRLSHVFGGSFDSSAAKAVINGSEFEKQHVLSHLNGSSFVSYSNGYPLGGRFYIHPFYRKLVKDKNMVAHEVKSNATKIYIDYFAELVYKASSLWFSKHSQNATQQFMTEENNILKMFDMSIEMDIRVFERSNVWLITDIIVVKALNNFFKPQILMEFYKTIGEAVEELEKNETTEEMSMFLKVCFAHIYLYTGEYDKANEYLQNYMELEAKAKILFPRYEVSSRNDLSRVYIKK